MAINRALRRSRMDRSVAGVIGGIAAYYDLPSTRMRIAYVILSILSAAFPGILVYLVLWFLIPSED